MDGARDAVLVVDDDVALGKVLVALLTQRGLRAVHVASAEAALQRLEAESFDVVLSDVRMPGMDGLGLASAIGERYAGLPVILITAHGSINLAVEAMKRGAVDFVQKPFDKDEIGFTVEKALEGSRAAREKAPSRPPSLDDARSFIGDSPAMENVFTTIRKVSPTTTTVLIRGETGTGKELVARSIHETSPRKGEAFVQVHCAALPESLLESELFGHEKGAFTGAVQRKPGRIELAHKGTLFLDEIGDIPLSVQVKLLRVIQERELERVGGTQTIRVDVRIVCATHRDLEAMVANGTFREDLFYRIAVVPIVVPPLRSRGAEDIARLARHFVGKHSPPGKTMAIDDDAVALLTTRPWPGNVRELQNFVERLVVLADTSRLRRSDVEHALDPNGRTSRVAADDPRPTLDSQRRETERDALLRALAQAGNNRSLAARLLDISRRTLYNKLREHGLE